jgi:DNA-binding XRE family transcriptional regulator
MYNIEEIREKLKDRRINIVAHKIGVHRFTLYKIRDGETKNPSSLTLIKLNEYFNEQEKK